MRKFLMLLLLSTALAVPAVVPTAIPAAHAIGHNTIGDGDNGGRSYSPYSPYWDNFKSWWYAL